MARLAEALMLGKQKAPHEMLLPAHGWAATFGLHIV
jgi:hypothetical protein